MAHIDAGQSPGSVLECLPDSRVPHILADRGFDLKPEPDGQRILPSAIVETVLIEGSTATRSVTHAGICRTRRFGLRLP